MSSTDLTARARIRQAALGVVAEKGVTRATIRQIAERAEVSPGLVMHHFGSKDGLLAACDDWVHDVVTREKSLLMGAGNPAMKTYLDDHPEYGPLLGYLNAVLREGGAPAARIFASMCDATAHILRAGVAAGTVREPDDLAMTVPVLVAFSCGAALFGDLIADRIGAPNLLDPPALERYGRAAMELFSRGMFSADLLPHPDHHSPTKDQQ